MLSRVYLCLMIISLSGTFGCAKKSMSERDTKREQLRLNAHKKRQELTPIAGNYRGQMTDASGYKQDISLHLELKDVPETAGGQVDPVLVPTVNGALNVTYGSGADVELFSFGTTKADFNVSDSRLDIVASNTHFKDINLSVQFSADKLDGTWSSTSTSQSGEVTMIRATELNLGGDTPSLRGVYPGILEWNDAAFFLTGALTFNTAQDGVDSFHVTASLKVNIPSPLATESFLYEFDAVEFNPFTRQVSIRSESSDLYMIGQLQQNTVLGKWYSKRIGLLGTATFSTTDMPKPPQKEISPAASGTWFGKIVNTNPNSRLPERLLASFNAVPDKSHPGGLALVGNGSLCFGSFSANDCVPLVFEAIDYQPFARKVVVAATLSDEAQNLTFQFDLKGATITGTITDSVLGQVANFSASHQPPANEVVGTPLGGEYNGVFLYDSTKTYQKSRITLVHSFNGSTVRLAAAVTLFLGDENSGEVLTYRFDETDFNSLTGILTLSNAASDVVIKASIANGTMTGEWFSTALGRLGEISLSKNSSTSAPAAFVRLPSIKGTYQGTLRSTSPNANLPERIMFGLITTPDPAAPRGLKVTGNLRLYLGPFDSTEFVELPFETLQIDPYRRTMSGKTSGSLRLTVQGNLSSDSKITGTLSDDSLGQVGEFEVKKNVP